MLGIAENELFIVTVMSCYDRKLEASRRDFRRASGVLEATECTEEEEKDKDKDKVELLPLHDVDCVLSSQEIFELITSTSTSTTTTTTTTTGNSSSLLSSVQSQWERCWLYSYCEQSSITTNWNEPLTSSGSVLYALLQSELEKHPSAQLQ